MSSHDVLTLHTTTEPQVKTHYKAARSYRQIVGVKLADKELWLPRLAIATFTSETFSVPEQLARNISCYFERYYLMYPDRYRNCHIGAAAMRGAMPDEDTKLGAMVTAENMAINVMRQSRIGSDLAIGSHGVFGEYIDLDDEEDDDYAEFIETTSGAGLNPHHSVIGLAPDLGIQTDSERGPFSLISHADNMAYYRTNRPNTELYYSAN